MIPIQINNNPGSSREEYCSKIQKLIGIFLRLYESGIHPLYVWKYQFPHCAGVPANGCQIRKYSEQSAVIKHLTFHSFEYSTS